MVPYLKMRWSRLSNLCEEGLFLIYPSLYQAIIDFFCKDFVSTRASNS